MRTFLSIVGLLLALPVLLVVVIGLGPVALGVLCGVGFGLIVFTLANFVIGIGATGRTVQRSRHPHAHA